MRRLAAVAAVLVVAGLAALLVAIGGTQMLVPLVVLAVIVLFVAGGNLLHGPNPYGRAPRTPHFAEPEGRSGAPEPGEPGTGAPEAGAPGAGPPGAAGR